MSIAVEVPEANEAATKLIHLAKEYAQKLNDAKERAYALRTELDGPKANIASKSLRGKDLWDFLRYLRPPAEQLARQASQLVEHGAISDAHRLELRLRLAELEHALFSATHSVHALPR